VIRLEDRELSVRVDPRGGAVSPHVLKGPDGGAAGHSRVILLLHGYANTLDDARASYQVFEGNLLREQPTIGGPNLPDIFRMYWPGDSELLTPLYYASYPADIGVAKNSAPPIEAYLRNLPAPIGGVIEIFLIAHSLGNRVLLELLNRFAGGNKPAKLQLRGAVMMAAAVPVAKVRFGGPLHYASLLPERRFALHSRSDMVLLLGFPLGEIAGGDALPLPWDWPEAVGRNGNPPTNWTLPVAMRRARDNKGYGHSDYWPGPEVSEPVVQALGVPTVRTLPSSAITSRTIGVAAGPLATRPAARATPARPRLG
jgi:alpha/beta hydrolase family protein DUF900